MSIETAITIFALLTASLSCMYFLIFGVESLEYISREEYEKKRKWIIRIDRLKRIVRSIKQRVKLRVLFCYCAAIAIKAKICSAIENLFK